MNVINESIYLRKARVVEGAEHLIRSKLKEGNSESCDVIMGNSRLSDQLVSHATRFFNVLVIGRIRPPGGWEPGVFIGNKHNYDWPSYIQNMIFRVD